MGQLFPSLCIGSSAILLSKDFTEHFLGVICDIGLRMLLAHGPADKLSDMYIQSLPRVAPLDKHFLEV